VTGPSALQLATIEQAGDWSALLVMGARETGAARRAKDASTREPDRCERLAAYLEKIINEVQNIIPINDRPAGIRSIPYIQSNMIKLVI
jgi:hypothetical protein